MDRISHLILYYIILNVCLALPSIQNYILMQQFEIIQGYSRYASSLTISAISLEHIIVWNILLLYLVQMQFRSLLNFAFHNSSYNVIETITSTSSIAKSVRSGITSSFSLPLREIKRTKTSQVSLNYRSISWWTPSGLQLRTTGSFLSGLILGLEVVVNPTT